MTAYITKQLDEMGLRIATDDESGWFVYVWDGNGKAFKVWATDE